MTKQESKQMSTDAQDVLPVHATIFEAIAATARAVRVIGKSERNKFDGYDFASIDKFLMLVNPICGRNGLFPIVSQRDVEFYDNVNSKGGKSVWARFFFDITLYHSSGEQLGPFNMMVCVPMNGAQTSGSAQSYALKQFFRSTLMIPTGDKDDADLTATEPHQRPDAPKFDGPAAAKRIRGKMAQATSLDDLKDRWTQEADTIAKIKSESMDAFQQIERAKNDRKAALEQADLPSDPPANTDLDGDTIPYEGPSQ